MKVPKATLLPSKTWFIRLRLGGESIPITAATEKECTKQSQLIKAEYLAGKRAPKAAGPVAEKLPTLREAIDIYIARLDNILSPATVRGYTCIRNNRFKGVMDKPISDIDDWQAVCNKEATFCSAKTLKNAWRFVGSAIRASGGAVPKVRLPQVVKKEIQWLQPEQIPVFLKALEGSKAEVPALLALSSFRRSEMCGLDWKDKPVDFKSNTVTVGDVAVYDKNQKLVTKEEAKNESSQRVVPIFIPQLIAALEREKKDIGPVVRYTPNALYKKINQICEKAGLPLVGVHGLRHSFASLGFHLRMSEQEIMDIGGWSDYQTVHKIYKHLAQIDRAKAQSKMAEFYKNVNENVNDENGALQLQVV
jgi:integrase